MISVTTSYNGCLVCRHPDVGVAGVYFRMTDPVRHDARAPSRAGLFSASSCRTLSILRHFRRSSSSLISYVFVVATCNCNWMSHVITVYFRYSQAQHGLDADGGSSSSTSSTSSRSAAASTVRPPPPPPPAKPKPTSTGIVLLVTDGPGDGHYVGHFPLPSEMLDDLRFDRRVTETLGEARRAHTASTTATSAQRRGYVVLVHSELFLMLTSGPTLCSHVGFCGRHATAARVHPCWG